MESAKYCTELCCVNEFPCPAHPFVDFSKHVADYNANVKHLQEQVRMAAFTNAAVLAQLVCGYAGALLLDPLRLNRYFSQRLVLWPKLSDNALDGLGSALEAVVAPRHDTTADTRRCSNVLVQLYHHPTFKPGEIVPAQFRRLLLDADVSFTVDQMWKWLERQTDAHLPPMAGGHPKEHQKASQVSLSAKRNLINEMYQALCNELRERVGLKS